VVHRRDGGGAANARDEGSAINFHAHLLKHPTAHSPRGGDPRPAGQRV